jgi:methyltransferase (TIGR00027 family)
VSDEEETEDKSITSVPFTARLMAHYRALENKRECPLFTDPFAERLAGDLSSYFGKYVRRSFQSDYPIARSYYIDQELLVPWCMKQKKSQVVILGAGLDTRAYRLQSLSIGNHCVYEVDFPTIIRYKEEVLKDEKPICSLTRIAGDLSNPRWASRLIESGFSPEMPTFWILEGVLYYLERRVAVAVLKASAEMSHDDSQMFADVCVPALSEAKFGPFLMHFKWGIDMDNVPRLFSSSGWNVKTSWADDHDQGRDVGQRANILVHGTRALHEERIELQSTDGSDFVLTPASILQEVELVASTYMADKQQGFSDYIAFIKRIRAPLTKFAKSQPTPITIGQISPRLMSNPLVKGTDPATMTPEEEEAHVAGYLTALVYLTYQIATNVEASQFRETDFFKTSQTMQSDNPMEIVISLVSLLKEYVPELSG